MGTLTNQTKSSTTISSVAKHVTGGYGYARYGMSVYGTTGRNLSNMIKTGVAYLWSSSVYPWQELLPWQFTGGSLPMTNQTKN